jgi:hypothetical protein
LAIAEMATELADLLMAGIKLDQEGHRQLRPSGESGGFTASLAHDHGERRERYPGPAISS